MNGTVAEKSKMNLTRGFCILCPRNSLVTKVVIPSEAHHITDLLRGLLANYIDVDKFKDTKHTLKVCPLCLSRLLEAYKYSKFKEFHANSSRCSLCSEKENLITVSDWSYLDKLLDNLRVKAIKKCCLCVSCIQYLDTLVAFKENFLYKYPHLKLTENQSEKKFKNKRNPVGRSLQQQGFTQEQCHYDEKLHTQVVKVLLTNRKIKAKLIKPTNFFKIKINTKVNKKKAKPIQKQRPSSDKELVVKITTKETKPFVTKASKKMVIEEPEVKKRNVSFNDTIEIIGESKPAETDSESEVEDKGYVAEILHHNDDIFNQLKTDEDDDEVVTNGVVEEVKDPLTINDDDMNGVNRDCDLQKNETSLPEDDPMVGEKSEQEEQNNDEVTDMLV